MRKPFAGNAATAHGNRNEGPARQEYMLRSGHVIDEAGFVLLRDDDAHGWLGASPDGLIHAVQRLSGDAAELARGCDGVRGCEGDSQGVSCGCMHVVQLKLY